MPKLTLSAASRLHEPLRSRFAPVARSWLIAAMLAVALLPAAAAPATDDAPVDWSSYSDELATLIGERLGREVAIGAILVEPELPPSVILRDVRIGNAPWGEAQNLLEVEEIRVEARITDLLRGDVVIPEIVVLEPKLVLERNEAGEANWAFAAPDPAVEGTGILPTIEDLRIEDAAVRYLDRAASIDLEAALASLTGQVTEAEGVRLAGTGSLSGRNLELTLTAGALHKLQQDEEPYPVDLQLSLGGSEMSFAGSITRPLTLTGLQGDVLLAGPTLAELSLGEFTLPDTPAYRLEGRLSQEGDRWRFDEAAGALGESRAVGWAQVELAGDRPQLRADLLIHRLRYDDLSWAMPAPGEADAPQGELFPDTAVPTDWLDAADGVLHVAVDQTEGFPVVALDGIDVRLTLRDRRLEAGPLTVGMAGGTLTGELALNGRADVPSADIRLHFDGVRIDAAVRDTRFADETSGEVQGHLYLLGVGATVDELAASLRGHVALVMRDGTVSGLILEGIGLDVVEALALYLGDDTPVAVRCGVLGMEVESGIATIWRLVLDTNDSLIQGQGMIDLDQERLDIRVEGEGKDFSLLNPDAPVFVQGPLLQPEISVGSGAFIPLIELGLQDDAPCERLQEEVLSLGEDRAARDGS